MCGSNHTITYHLVDNPLPVLEQIYLHFGFILNDFLNNPMTTPFQIYHNLVTCSLWPTPSN